MPSRLSRRVRRGGYEREDFREALPARAERHRGVPRFFDTAEGNAAVRKASMPVPNQGAVGTDCQDHAVARKHDLLKLIPCRTDDARGVPAFLTCFEAYLLI